MPSTSVAILQSGQVTSHCYSTVGDDADTLFQACSISKAVAAMAIMRLVDDGHFTLDSTIETLLPSSVLTTLTDGYPPTHVALVHAITIRQLMSHTAGLTTGGFPGYKTDNVPSAQEVLAGQYPVNTLRVRLAGLPGQSFSYSGGGITVLQLILETLTKKDFPTLMKDLVLTPLGMTRSFYGRLPAGEKAARAHLTGTTPADVSHHVFAELAAAGLWTTPTDLLKVVAAVQKSHADGGFLKKETARTMLTEVRDAFALSWQVPGDDRTNFTHTGSNDPGYRSVLVGFAQLGVEDAPKDCGLAVMTNGTNGTVQLWRVALAVSYFNGWPIKSTIGSGNQVVPFVLDEDVGTAWKGYIGDWKDEKHTRQYKLTDEDGKPCIAFNGDRPVHLQPGARPGAKTDEGFVTLVLKGFDLWLQLGEKDGKKTITMHDGLAFDSFELTRDE